MCYVIIPTPKFENDIAYYEKKKKYKHIVDDITKIVQELEQGNLIGDIIPELNLPNDNHTYKVRSANTDIKVGKSNGYRIIYYVIRDDKEIYLITIYSKKDDNRVTGNKEIEELVKEYCT